jgi:hypothetical protein
MANQMKTSRRMQKVITPEGPRSLDREALKQAASRICKLYPHEDRRHVAESVRLLALMSLPTRKPTAARLIRMWINRNG